MLETKMLEIRDAATYIPVLAIKMTMQSDTSVEEAAIEAYHLTETGYDVNNPLIVVVRLDPIDAQHDPFGWSSRTMKTAHSYITDYFDKLQYGDVIDVEYILGIKRIKKTSQRFG